MCDAMMLHSIPAARYQNFFIYFFNAIQLHHNSSGDTSLAFAMTFLRLRVGVRNDGFEVAGRGPQ